MALACLDWNVWVIEEGCVCCLHRHVVWEFDDDSLGTRLFVGAMRICANEVTCTARVCDGAVVERRTIFKFTCVYSWYDSVYL